MAGNARRHAERPGEPNVPSPWAASKTAPAVPSTRCTPPWPPARALRIASEKNPPLPGLIQPWASPCPTITTTTWSLQDVGRARLRHHEDRTFPPGPRSAVLASHTHDRNPGGSPRAGGSERAARGAQASFPLSAAGDSVFRGLALVKRRLISPGHRGAQERALVWFVAGAKAVLHQWPGTWVMPPGLAVTSALASVWLSR